MMSSSVLYAIALERQKELREGADRARCRAAARASSKHPRAIKAPKAHGFLALLRARARAS